MNKFTANLGGQTATNLPVFGSFPIIRLPYASNLNIAYTGGFGPKRVQSEAVSNLMEGPAYTESERPQTIPVAGTIILAFVMATILLFRYAADLSRTPSPVETLRFLVDVNRASESELRALPDVGPKLASRIVEYRLIHGPFGSLEDLTHVRGLGPKTLEKLTPMLYLAEQDPTIETRLAATP